MALAVTMARRHSLMLFFVLSFTLTWLLIPLMKLSPILAIPGSMMPAVAAWVVLSLGEGRFGSIRLGRRLSVWRVDLVWYVTALALPPLLSLAAVYTIRLSGTAGPIELLPITPIVLILLLIAAGEEIGWRGYALPKLLESFPPLASAIILGLMWGFWRVPLFSLPGMPPLATPLGAYLVYTTAFSVILTWMYQNTRASVPLAILMHASADIFIFTNSASPDRMWWALAAVFLIAAIIVTVIVGPDLKRT